MRLEELKTDYDRRVAEAAEAPEAWPALWRAFVDSLQEPIELATATADIVSFAMTVPSVQPNRLIASLTRTIDIDDPSLIPDAINLIQAQLVVSAFWEPPPDGLRELQSVGRVGIGASEPTRPELFATELSREEFAAQVEALPSFGLLSSAAPGRWASYYVPPSEMD